MRRPNFFIVGAPKCGTTALYAYLGTHPNVFLCEPKEPNFFSTDFPTHRYVTETNDYLRLFQNASESERLLGEASAWYLYSQDALANIHRFDRNAKIIAMVRNPIDMVPSLHGMLLRNFAEHETCLECAWDLQEARRTGKGYARDRNKRFDPKTCLYADACKLGAQVEKLFDTFPRDQVHVIVFDDFVRDTKRCYEEVLRFLQVPSDGRKEFPAENVRQSLKSRHLAWLIWNLRDMGTRFKRRLGVVRSFNVLALFRPFYESTQARPTLSPEFRQRLVAEFQPDIERLSDLIGRDLSDWLESSNASPPPVPLSGAGAS
mgnify:CR=1 FL=1